MDGMAVGVVGVVGDGVPAFGGGWGWPYDYGYANPGLYAYSPGFVGAGFGGGCSCNRGWWQ
jgi:hypothetical protein